MESIRHRELVLDGSPQEEADLWALLDSRADDLSGEYIYKAVDLFGISNNDVYGPSVNSNSFVSSILRYAQAEGHDIGSFNTDANVVGNQTWLGTTGDDVLDAGIQFTNGDEAQSLFGGKGADTLIGDDSGISVTPVYLVAGADMDVDTLRGGNGADVPGYFNGRVRGPGDALWQVPDRHAAWLEGKELHTIGG